MQSIYVLNRKVEGDQGETFNQSVAVYARSDKEAKELVMQEFGRIRKASNGTEHPYYDKPEFYVNRIELDTEKVLIHWITD